MKRPRLWNDPTCKLPEDNYNQYSFSNATEKMNKIKKMLEMEDDHVSFSSIYYFLSLF